MFWLLMITAFAICGSRSLATEMPNLGTNRLALWLKADGGVITNGNGFVSKWLDQSGNDNHAMQAGLDAMPQVVQENTERQSVVRFGGQGDFLEIAHSPSLVIEHGIAVFAVVRLENLADYTNGLIAKTVRNLPAPFDLYLQPGGQPRLFTGDGEAFSFVWGKTNVTTNRWVILSVVINGTNGTTFLNGVYNGESTMKVPMKDLGGTVRIGTRADFQHWLKGDLAELILVRGTVSIAERRAIHDYLGQKHGLNVVLDVSMAEHPGVGRLEGQTATFSASALSSDSKINFQWQKNEKDIPDATNTIYTTPALTLEDDHANFCVRVTSGDIVRYSKPISVNILPDTEPLTVTTAAFLLRDQSQSSTNGQTRLMLPPYSSRFWQTSEEPARSVVQAIAQTADGRLWIGTEGGLARFDGHGFEFVSVRGNEKSSLQRINALNASADGALWIGSVEDGLLEYRGNKWKSHPLSTNQDPAILTLARTRSGELWVGTRIGLALSRGGNLSLSNEWLSSTNPGQNPLSSARTIRALAQDAKGNIWVGHSEQVLRLQTGKSPETIDVSPCPLSFVRSVLCSTDGSTWVGGNSGLIRMRDGEISHFSKNNGLPDNVVTALYEDRRGNIWIGTSGGLCRFADGRFVVEMTEDGQLYNQIFCFFEDRENNLWVGAKNGLYQLRVQQFTTYTTRHGLAHNNVISVCEDKSGAMWIGTWGGGLHSLRDGRITIYSSAKNKVMRNDLILAIHGARDGGIWFSEDYDGGLYSLKGAEMKRHFGERGSSIGPTRALLETTSGDLLVGTSLQSIQVLRGETVVRLNGANALPTDAIRSLLETRDGRIWIGTEAGLSVKTDEGIKTFTTSHGLSDNGILSLYEDKEQTLWIGTSRGLNRLPGNGKGRIVSYSSESGLFQDAVLEILEDEDANLWIASRRGVFRVNKRALNDFAALRNGSIPYTTFGKAEGMYSPVCVGAAKPSAFKSKDGRLWFATTKGLAVTDPELKIEKNETKPPVVIAQVSANRKSLQIAGLEGPKLSTKTGPETIVVGPGNGELEIHYLALSYTSPENNRFKYKLQGKGADSEWVDAETRQVAYYNNLAPGDYTFQVIACNNDGVWNEEGASVKLRFLPQFWQTGWFLGGVGIAAVCFVGGFARFATRRNLQRKFERLERQHAIERERTRIAADLHDQLGASLTRVYVLNELATRDSGNPESVALHTGKSSETLRAISKTLHEIVWAVNPQNDTLRRLAAFIAHYTEEFFESMPVRCRFDIPGELPDLPLSAETRHNVFLVVKEALNNIAKHAGATEVRVDFKVEDCGIEILLADNGKGFAPEKADSSRNGLQNMRRRMAEAGGSCQLRSQEGRGTTIVLRLPTRRNE